MRPQVSALLLAGLLVAAGAALSLADRAPHADAGPEDAPVHAHGASRHAAEAGGAHAWRGGKGEVPDRARAMLELERRSVIVIDGDAGFNPANGVRTGTGTFDDPFVIAGWFVDRVLIKDTSAAFELKENYVSDLLVLDWTGQGGYVHHNHVDNLRTNRNVARVGDPTAAVIEHNEILRVEELRHFDGELKNNTIGPTGADALLRPRIALNIAGLNGAGIHDNVIHGGVDMKLHGHHHSGAHGARSHNHGQPDAEPVADAANATPQESGDAAADAHGHGEDHTVRHIDFLFARNRIVDSGFGLRYNDLDHAGDDRTATSEQEPDLELPHVHTTTVTIRDNVIEGATLRVVVMNAPDERHLDGETGRLLIEKNRILKPAAGDGLLVQDARNARVEVRGNVVEKGDLHLAGTSAILLVRFQNATVLVEDNVLGPYAYGVRAHMFDANTTWHVSGNRGDARQPVYWDETVQHPPQQDDAHDHDGHDHGGEATAAAPFDVRNNAFKSRQRP